MRSVTLQIGVLVSGLVQCLPGETAFAASPDPARLTAQIDYHCAASWNAAKVKVAVAANDAMFVRRVYLDLIGRIPMAAEVRNFLENNSPEKRTRLIAQLLDTRAHARHWAVVWRREWIPQADLPQSSLGDEVDEWLASQLHSGKSYDRIVRDLLQANSAQGSRRGAPTTFLTASEFKPENLAANTTRAFLGINLDCAQCHNHPFARWSRDQFWQTAAFFARPSSSQNAAPATLKLLIPNTKKTVGPRFLSGSQPLWPKTLQPESGRVILANWVTTRDNPYFAKNAVNRLWANLLGTGLVEPLDDLSGENPASHPELLDDLAKAFANSGFDVKYLLTAIIQSKAYQLSSVLPPGGSNDPRLFSTAAVRGLTGEQLHDSLRVAAGLSVLRDDLDPLNAFNDRKRFAAQFRIDRASSAQRSILQALSLMNGKRTAGWTDSNLSPLLQAVADAPFLDTKDKIEALYLAALSRKPSATEFAFVMKHVEKGGADDLAKKALADILWSLLNSSEFSTNH